MKLIDVLVMISKGELKEGTKIMYKDSKFIWECNNLFKEGTGVTIFDEYSLVVLDNKVELIDPKENTTEKIKELDVRTEIENFHDVEFIFTDIACKLNEVIRRINNVR